MDLQTQPLCKGFSMPSLTSSLHNSPFIKHHCGHQSTVCVTNSPLSTKHFKTTAVRLQIVCFKSVIIHILLRSASEATALQLSCFYCSPFWTQEHFLYKRPPRTAPDGP